MVVFIDYDRDMLNQHHLPARPDTLLHACLEPKKQQQPALSKLSAGSPKGSPRPADKEPLSNLLPSLPKEEQTPNRNAFSAALSCYPIIKEIARSIDLNTLHALARTCRQFHANMAPYRPQLVKQTLRCENEYIETLSDMLDSKAAIPRNVKSVIQLLSENARSSGRMTRGKVGKCARDMVAECHRCSKVVCRNCTIKPPNNNMLKNRIRRLCTTCRTAPLNDLIHPPCESSSSSPTTPPLSPSQTTISAFQRTPCSCSDAIWLCHQCGHQVRSNDTTYRRVWSWRTRYSTYLGGLGTGIGEGCQGVKCGRGEDCLAAQEIEMEVECEADEASGSPTDYDRHYGPPRHAPSPPRQNHPHTPLVHPSAPPDVWDHREEDQPGYFRQEIIGIGGRVKHKSKKRVTVGACVVEYEDERDSGDYLVREEKGLHRSWWQNVVAGFKRRYIIYRYLSFIQ
ncbi:hypothetical protein BO70DRAFT_377979 [Aspergillus heteromorphus CBS 117.55]|uniref:F-box domain-containing protein n=1 Tax=Aspergillus heteromorphus CBS 117.55 TaxID=1448321 RepID=A0A317WT86_9EURO|nr:uncharacterized protein BO70DRAFT_377979 [Aspergillus heteromorphus CBS 117.55]PWY88502.1 hypothetical protein BO70DRAFT_377979 [Aspergillus heteromorphus CBS 117.55]